MTHYSRDDLTRLIHDACERGREPHIENALFSFGDYASMNLSSVELPRSLWEGSVLVETDLRYSDLSGARLIECDLTGVKFLGTGYTGITFDKCDLTQALCPSADFAQSRFTHCQAPGMRLDSAILSETFWEQCNLTGATLGSVEAIGAKFVECDLSVSARYADFRGTSFHGSTMNEADLSWSNLFGAHFLGASLQRVNLYGAFLENAHFESVEQLRAASLEREVKQALFSLFAHIGHSACWDVAKLLQKKMQGNFPDTPLEHVIWCGTESEEKREQDSDDENTRERKERRAKMKQAALNFAAGSVQHEHHDEGNPVAHIILEWLDEYLSQ